MILVREAESADCDTIAHFQEKMAMETENLELDPGIVGSGVNAVFSDPSKGKYYVAEKDKTIAGCLLTTAEWSDWRNGRIIWIQSVYVLPEWRNKGIYKKLYNHIKQLVEEDPYLKGIRLYVDKTNEKAIQIYQHCGMDDEHYKLFEWIRK